MQGWGYSVGYTTQDFAGMYACRRVEGEESGEYLRLRCQQQAGCDPVDTLIHIEGERVHLGGGYDEVRVWFFIGVFSP